MAHVPKDFERTQLSAPDANGLQTFNWQLTGNHLGDTVKLTMPPSQALPIIFVPGIMGSNLCTLGRKPEPVWLLNATFGQPVGLAWMWARKGSGTRQKMLHPERTQVYRGGDVPSKGVGTIADEATFIKRGWGEVGETSYQAFLLWLEQKMNGEGFDPARWEDFFYTSVSATPEPGAAPVKPTLFPGIPMKMSGLPPIAEDSHATEPVMSDDLLKRARYRFPVYACGYNWLESNTVAADRLKERIDEVIAENNNGHYKCAQVILVTHSMGGLVARSCADLPGMQDKIAGIVHGVMPALGAAVAYRRCKVGMRDESFIAGLVIGSNGKEVTSVFAQAPGALQLLPSTQYRKHWLNIKDQHGKTAVSLPAANPYNEIYKRKDRWWGLVNEDWLSPRDGQSIVWNEFIDNIDVAEAFHDDIAGKYHPRTFVYYGAGGDDQASFENVAWQMKKGVYPASGTAPTAAQIGELDHDGLRTDSSNKLYVGGETKIYEGYGEGMPTAYTYETSFWEVSCAMQDGRGDGTVPTSSGLAPRAHGGANVRQQFRLQGFLHEPSFKDPTAQRVTHYAITKIAALAKVL